MYKKNLLKNSIFIKYIATHIAILLIPIIIVTVVIYTINISKFKENNNETFLKKQSHFLLQCLLILSEANNTFGKNHVKAYVNVKQINILLKQNAHKIYIPGVKDGD